jgi:hypothetical protein
MHAFINPCKFGEHVDTERNQNNHAYDRQLFAAGLTSERNMFFLRNRLQQCDRITVDQKFNTFRLCGNFAAYPTVCLSLIIS